MKPLVTAAMIQSVQIDDKLGPPSEQLAGALNAALEPLLEEREAALLDAAAGLVCDACGPQNKFWHSADSKGYHLHIAGHQEACKCFAVYIRKLSSVDALARHDAAVRLEAIRECAAIARKHQDQKQPYDKYYGEEGLGASATTAGAILDELAALEGKP